MRACRSTSGSTCMRFDLERAIRQLAAVEMTSGATGQEGAIPIGKQVICNRCTCPTVQQVQETASCHLVPSIFPLNCFIIQVGLLVSVVEHKRWVWIAWIASNVICQHQQDIAVRNAKPAGKRSSRLQKLK